MSCAIGLVGLAVMGQNLALNIADKGFAIAVFNRTAETTQQFAQQNTHPLITATYSYPALVQSLQKPRVIMLMVKAGRAVDDCIQQLLPLLEAGDIIIDGGNSYFDDTQRRYLALKQQQLLYVGMGVSGGESGARHGPSIMPGGNSAAWPIIQPIFQKIAAHVENTPCCNWIGDGASGHYVKMVHNGIEYGDMQLITEAYALLRFALALNAQQLHDTFQAWNSGVLNSYLIEITANIFSVYDNDGSLLLDNIVDAASQKGTGKWTVTSALDEAIPLTLISEAVFARFLSANKTLRQQAHALLAKPVAPQPNQALINSIHDALYAAKIMSYAQGFLLLQQKATQQHWQLDYAEIAKLWRGGCIIRSQFLNDIASAYQKQADLPCLLFADFFKSAVTQCLPALRQTVITAIQHNIAVPALSSALAFYDGLTTEHSAANLLQAQRDYFGAHTYQRIDAENTQYFHSDWESLIGNKP